ADDYRRAIRECANLPEDWRASTQVDLLYRRSIALALPSESQDLELVTRLFQQAGEIKLSTPSQSTRIVRALAATLIRTFGTARKLDCQGGSDCIFALLQQLQGVNKSLDRDELERLMFSYKVLLAGSERFGIDRLGRLRLADDLLALCQSVCQLAAGDPDLLRYLRPYFDVVFLEKKLLEPKHCKELIEVAWLASRGVPYVKPPQARPLLVMHVAAGRGYLLLDVPAGMSQCFLVDEETSLHDLVVASQSGALLPLPVAVRRALSNVEGPLVVRWRDPAISAGTCGRMLPYMLGFEMKPRRHYPEAVKIATRRGSAPSRPAPVPDEPTLDSSVPQVPEAPLIGPEPGDLQPSSRYVFPFNMTAALARGRVMDESDKYPAPSGDDIRSRKREDELTANEEVARPKR
ncbi:MAG TPA: hypothetical protein VFF52_14805, partial [Isosphaeraceae bacterium]|nr:hypothetical protein [Isosphaeraceae bacterium]